MSPSWKIGQKCIIQHNIMVKYQEYEDYHLKSFLRRRTPPSKRCVFLCFMQIWPPSRWCSSSRLMIEMNAGQNVWQEDEAQCRILFLPPLSPHPHLPRHFSSSASSVPLPALQWQYEISHLKKHSQIFDLDDYTEDASSQLWVPRLPTPCSWLRYALQWVQTAWKNSLQHWWTRSQMADVQCLVWGRAHWWGISWGGKRLLFFLSRQMVLRIWQALFEFFSPF